MPPYGGCAYQNSRRGQTQQREPPEVREAVVEKIRRLNEKYGIEK